MEIPLARYQSISLDQLHSNSSSFFSVSNLKVFNRNPLISTYKSSRRDFKSSFDKTVSSALDQVLKPRPRPQINIQEVEGNVMKKPNARICSQIEKLVLCNKYREALELFEIFENNGCFDISSRTYDALVSACIGLRSVRGVKRVFSYMLNNGFKCDPFMMNRVLIMHVKCGMMIDARKLFDEMPDRDAVSWNTMIFGLVESGNYLDAFHLLKVMLEDFSACSPRTLSVMIRASAGLELIDAGRQFHSYAMKMGLGHDIFVSCALIDMYSKCGSIKDARLVFDKMPEKTTVGWNSIITGYALHGYSEEALSMCYEMRNLGVFMDDFTFTIIINICTRLASLQHAKQAHAALIRNGFGLDLVASTTLVDFYSKWGRVEDARHIFNEMPNANLISWNALIAGYGNHGKGEEAVKIYEQMINERVRPNHVTFLAVLSACSYSGLFNRGWEIYQSMTRDHKIKPRAMHLSCIIELLGREGQLDEAYAVIRNAPFKPTTNMWAALLTACRYNSNLELGLVAAEKLYGMGPEKLSNYVVLFNIYNSSGRLQEAEAVLQSLNKKGLRMLPACSWIEIKNKPYIFLFGDTSHVQTREIYHKVDKLMLEISKYGYVPEQKGLLPDVDEGEECMVSYHSEKLAIGFGLINTSEKTPLQIVQGHRICNGCHKAIKLITSATDREIVIRDASRFHHFKDGNCSCGDYW